VLEFANVPEFLNNQSIVLAETYGNVLISQHEGLGEGFTFCTQWWGLLDGKKNFCPGFPPYRIVHRLPQL